MVTRTSRSTTTSPCRDRTSSASTWKRCGFGARANPAKTAAPAVRSRSIRGTASPARSAAARATVTVRPARASAEAARPFASEPRASESRTLFIRARVLVPWTASTCVRRASASRASAARAADLAAAWASSAAAPLPGPGVVRGAVPAREDRGPALVEAHRRVAERVEQRAVVRDDDARSAEAPERGDEERAGRRVEVVRRLVEAEDVRLARERGADGPPLALAGRERRPPGERLDLEPEATAELAIRN